MNWRLGLLTLACLALAWPSAHAADTVTLYPVQIDGKWGYIDATGELRVAATWDSAEPFSEGLGRVQRGDLYGYVDGAGAVAIKPAFLSAHDFHDGFAAVGQKPVLDLDAGDDDLLLSTDPDQIKWGYIDQKGAVVVPLTFAAAGDFHAGRAPVQAIEPLGRWGRIGPAPKWFVPPRFAFESLPKWGYIDPTGKWLVPARFDVARTTGDDAVAVVRMDDEGFRLLRADGQLSELEFHQLGTLCRGLAPAYRLEQVATAESLADRLFAEPTDELRTDSKADTLKQGNKGTAIAEEIGYGYVDATGSYVIAPQFERAFSFQSELARVQIERKFGYIDMQGKVVIQPRYSDAQDFSDGLAAVQDRGFWIYVDATGKRAFDRRFDRAGPFVAGIARVVSFDDVQYIDRTGRTIWPRD